MNRTLVSALRSYAVALRHFGLMVADNTVTAAELEEYTGLTSEMIARADEIKATAENMKNGAKKSK